MSSPVYNGVRSVRLGIPNGVTNRLAYSTVFQKVTIPANAPTPVRLRYAFLSNGPADGYDYRETLLLNSSYKYLATLERRYVVGDGKWVLRTFDLSAYRGQTVVIYFNVYNNGSGTQKWGYVDRVFLGGCSQTVLGEADDGPVLLPEVETPGPEVGGVTWDVYLPAVER
ncbi:MAG: hypothetical protein IPK16_31920 [Anaerolineales bacterium]|nr:hypothetical protein [Anaerolineales bacterium]